MVYKLPKEAIVENELDAGVLDSNLVNSFVPIGGIIMWSVTVAQAEALTNWAICDGQNGTPDLRDRFVLGVGSSVAASTASVDDTLAYLSIIAVGIWTNRQLKKEKELEEKQQQKEDEAQGLM